ncbi:MAG: hypothetical protein ACI8Z0_001592 [Lentimonas sp.]|jgi:hypothetical protein
MRYFNAIFLSCGIAGAAQADGFCDPLDRVMAQDEAGMFSLPAPFESNVQCLLSMML